MNISREKIVDTHQNITIPDNFVVRENTIFSSTGHGEGKLYLGRRNDPFLRSFYGPLGFEINCFFFKKDLKRFLMELEPEYKIPRGRYKGNLSKLFSSRLNKISLLPNVIEFSVKHQDHLAGGRLYINSKDENYFLLRELSLSKLCYIDIMKIRNQTGFDYLFKPSVNFFEIYKQTVHPSEVEKQEETTKTQLITARLGQGKFRKDVLKECIKCPITKVDQSNLLIASHIKPWVKSDNIEKLDPKNGFVFTPTIDRLFDRGYLSFKDNKKILISPWVSDNTLKMLKLSSSLVVSDLPIRGREVYLKYHRNNIFKS